MEVTYKVNYSDPTNHNQPSFDVYVDGNVAINGNVKREGNPGGGDMTLYNRDGSVYLFSPGIEDEMPKSAEEIEAHMASEWGAEAEAEVRRVAANLARALFVANLLGQDDQAEVESTASAHNLKEAA